MDDGRRHEHDSRPPPPAKQGSLPRSTMELDAIASVVGEERSPVSKAGLGSPCVAGHWIIGFVFACFVVLVLRWSATYKEPNYTVAIAAVSGLDPATDIGCRPVLDPVFNLTVGIVRRSGWLQGNCDELGTTLKVAYRGYELASEAAPQVCGLREGDGGTNTTVVVARGTRVWLSAPVLESLAADVRSAAGVFDVTIAIRIDNGQKTVRGDGSLVSCMGRRIGDGGGGDGDAALCDTGVLRLPRAH